MHFKSYKLNLFAPLGFAVFLAASLVIGIIFYLQYMAIEERKLMSVPNFEHEFQRRLENKKNALDAFLELLKNDTKLQKPFIEKNIQKLYETALPIYKKLNEKMNITHLYFLDLDGKVLLRVHDRNRHSDVVERFTFKEAQKTQMNSAGVEFGIKKNFTLRNVHPWIVNNKLIGYIELGQEIDKIMKAIADITKIEIFMAVKKEFFTNLPEFVQEKTKTFFHTRDYYVVYNTMQTPWELKALLESEVTKSLHIKVGEEFYHTSSLRLKDISQRELGYFIFLTNATFERALFIKTMFILVISVASFLFILFLIWKRLSKNRESQINAMAKKLMEIAITDELTGLYNRKHFNEQGLLEINRAKRERKCFSMLMIDIDYFKVYNDTYGHQAGDEAIKAVAKTMQLTFKRASDYCFRVGGEEFAVLVSHEEEENLFNRANTLRQNIIDQAIEHRGSKAAKVLTVSIGLVMCPYHEIDTLDILYKRADRALYDAKENGRNQVSLCKEKDGEQ